jgi:curved DNA-binding protein CbpA
MPDFYEVLQVHPNAEPEVIRAAYRILARKYHPDHGGDAARMIALNNAWDVLGDQLRRAEYDASRSRPAARNTPEGARYPEARSAGSGARSEASAPRTPDINHAGPPPGRPSGTVLDFGRYAGWSLGEIARHDLDYLEWLQRATFGRRLRAEIDTLLRQRRGPGEAAAPVAGRGWPGRR